MNNFFIFFSGPEPSRPHQPIMSWVGVNQLNLAIERGDAGAPTSNARGAPTSNEDAGNA
jgi:hypothetical protein